MRKYYVETNTLIIDLKKEREELKNKVEKLDFFILDHRAEDCTGKQIDQLHLLTMQSYIIHLYIGILNERISNLIDGGYIG